ncbi:hypothetical protein [Luteimonas aquatica]|uniref:hypothetical protein n=1 Tax=Luteimonas aquatica TaxID=450364 RepID=UPI001F57574E|nr:hypothetical protein [Luteimonas aquatica]
MLIFLLVLAVSGAFGWHALRTRAPAGAFSDAGPSAAPAAVPASATELAALRATPQARDYAARRAFDADIRAYLREASAMNAVQRSERARALSAQIDAYERARQLSAGEALLLRAALIQASGAEEPARAEQMAALVQRYRDTAQRREAEWNAQLQHDPKFRDYKSREREIVAEVMAMPHIPGGLSRDAYLRQRLLQAREQAYRQ